MKSFIFLIIIAICAIKVICVNNYQQIAIDLNTRVTAVLGQLKTLSGIVATGLENVSNVTTNFGLNGQYRFVQTRDVLNKKTDKAGIKKCQDLLQANLNKLIEDVRGIVKPDIVSISTTIRTTQTALANIQTNTNSGNVGGEINDCIKSAATCRLTGAYAKSTDDATNFIKNNTKVLTTNDVIMVVYGRKSAIVSNKIEDAIRPVMDCQKPIH